ncbi:MAG TPA: CBS domain-containing protein, partial [Candidatus Acidoferrales bacterium]|nr:CBS domain-containing protein [Candidatus Acidoferrales bacterium]
VVDLMTADPVALSPWDTIQQADELMNEHRIRQLPVVADAELVGIITDRDIRSFLSGRLFSTPAEREAALNTKVEAVMSPDPITVGPDDDLRDAVELLIEEKIGGIPVVENDRRLVGIITYVDALRRFLDVLDEKD